MINIWFFFDVFFIIFSERIWVRDGNIVFYNVWVIFFIVFVIFCSFCFVWIWWFIIVWIYCNFRIVFRMIVFYWRGLWIIICVWKSFYVIIVIIVIIIVWNVGYRFVWFFEWGFNGGLYLIIFIEVYNVMFLKKG